ncbi:MAG TPA: hypothetical protein VKU40_07570 [Thermoanaerobaculia bacterium]|nr:hypothetical protein [Thermoanaerobaculia bacterium]
MRREPVAVLGWLLLAGLLVALLVGAATADRAAWPSLVGDEATYAMQAQSLAHDADLVYERQDYDRFVAAWGKPPDGLILQSRSAGYRLVYSKAFPYALAVAPASRLSPTRGPLVMNVLFLAVAALLSASVLRRRVGPAAPLWVAVFCFASVAFAYAFWVHADLFLMCATACGLALAYRGEAPAVVARGALPDVYQPPRGEWESRGGWRPLVRWLAVGLLLAVPIAYRPFYAGLLLPAALAAFAEAREERGGAGRKLAVVALGVVLVVGLSSLVQWAAGGDWSPYGGERQGFYSQTGFPEVDFPAEEWSDSVRRWGNTSWFHEESLSSPLGLVDLGLLSWNSVYWAVGRDVGVLPYFLPLLLGVVAFSASRGRWALVLAVLAAAAGFFFFRAFNFYGGGGAIANRYFLPIYPALWFLAARAPEAIDRAGWRRAFGGLCVALMAAPFLYPLWLAPRAFPIGDDGRYRHVSTVAESWLPFETTQSHLPGGQDRAADGLWFRIESGLTWNGAAYAFSGDGPGRLLIGSPEEITGLHLAFAAGGPSEIEVDGGEVENRIFTASGGSGFAVGLDGPRAVHPMWWTEDDWYLYEIEVAPADGQAAVPFTVGRGAAVGSGPGGGPGSGGRER